VTPAQTNPRPEIEPTVGKNRGQNRQGDNGSDGK
jgi:hypothetical protein